MRVTGGEWRGRVLRVPRGRAVRPTSDRVKQALFNVLAARVPGSRVLDLFAGTGGLGIEALSRGAREALFVEADPRVAGILRENLEALGAGERAAVWRQDVFSAVAKLAGDACRFDLILADPPYRRGLAARTVEAVADAGLLAADGVLVLEHDPREELPETSGGLQRVRADRYGDTGVAYYMAVPAGSAAPAAAGEGATPGGGDAGTEPVGG
ncbi:MAG: 16S rRNA (guanine(966)-N(2))-methyltransferase RsmD [Bacillota bacterium]|nr:MAG: 16S rRNA (guanine(966)-N(2))-methyltransferase RsmD [Bacillota bacterium]